MVGPRPCKAPQAFGVAGLWDSSRTKTARDLKPPLEVGEAVRGRPQQRSGVSVFSRQLPLVDGAADLPLGRAVGRRRDRRRQPRRPRAARQGRRRRRVVRGMDPHGRHDRGARPRRRARTATGSPPRPASMRAARYYQTGERFLQPKSQRGMDVYAKSVKIVPRRRRDHPPPAHRAGRNSVRGHEPAGAAGASRSRRRRRASGAGDGVLRRLRRHQGDPVRLRDARSRGARHRLPDRRRAGQRRERALPQSAADRGDRALRHAGLRLSRRPSASSIRSASA